MKERLLTGWSLRRVFYLVIGLAMVVQSVIVREWFIVFFGAYFAAMGIFGFGCAGGNCYSGNCSVPPPRQTGNPKIKNQ